MRARDIMTTPVHTIGQDAPVQAAVELLTATSVTALPCWTTTVRWSA